MKRTFALCTAIIATLGLRAQIADSSEVSEIKTPSERISQSQNKLQIGGYAQIDYNQPLSSENLSQGTLDVHRLVMLFGYRFNERTQFFTEIEYEHVSEVYIEQAYLDYRINPYITFRGGLVLIPMGIINEYHEPPTFNGVERPAIDNKIAPTTWRELGAGFTGNIIDASLKYQLYVVNGFSSYNGSAQLNGKDALRKGRQKGAESYITSPNLSTKVEYYGLPGLNLGLSGYFGKTQSTAYDGLGKDDEQAIASADSSVVGISMIGLDGRYNIGGLQLRGQLYYTKLSNTNAYNVYTASNGVQNNLGSAMTGYYIEAGYNVFKTIDRFNSELIPFIRYESYNTHASTEGNLSPNQFYHVTLITTGLGWKITPAAMLKCDLEFARPENMINYSKTLNAGVAVMF